MDSRTQVAVNKAVSLAVDAVDQKQTEQIEALVHRVSVLEKRVASLEKEIVGAKVALEKGIAQRTPGGKKAQ